MNDIKAQAEFTEFVLREMPAGTIISDPAWWAPRLWRAAVHAMTRQDAPVKESLTTDERARFEAETFPLLTCGDTRYAGRSETYMFQRAEFNRADGSAEYFHAVTEGAWLAWQARAKIAGEQWRCFHCGEVFTDTESACLHFGATERKTPVCEFDGGGLAELRRLENELQRYREEDSDKDRQMYRMASDHQLALRRAEEAGYAKALKDTNYKEPAPAADAAQTIAVGFTLEALRAANIARQIEWCDNGVMPDLSYRGNELAGEVGEACNVVKKLERERLGWPGSRTTLAKLAKELGDVVICADLVATAAGINLADGVLASFNDKSREMGHATFLTATPPTPADDARDAGHNLLRQALAAMAALRQGLESPDKNDGQYIFNAGAVRAFVDEQARLMFEEKRLTDRAVGGE